MLVSDEEKAFPINITLARDERVPERMKNPANWPEAMRVEYGEDEGVAAAAAHRERLVKSFRVVNDEIQAFNPDFVLIFGDDQYENFRETIIPPFCILAYEDSESVPFSKGFAAGKRNAWDEPADKTFRYRGHPEAARWLAAQLIEQGVDMAYAYKPLHEPGLGHAFLNTLLYLDYDRAGFDYPVIPFAINCYGSRIIRNRGGASPQTVNGVEAPADPPGPSPKRCMELGAAAARAMLESPWRVALIASSSWSHAFLTEKNSFVYPDLEADRVLLEALRNGEYDTWKNWTLHQVEESGQQETLNWQCLVGAMAELNRRADYLEWAECWSFNAPKCLAVFK
jgi:hypothetical protein